MKRLILLASMVLTLPLRAQDSERILIPLTVSGVAGANGSLWSSFVTLTNHSGIPLQVFGYGPCHIHPCFPEPIEAETTLFPSSVAPFLEVERARADDLTVHLRVQDLSRQSQTWGTSIPVVRERDVFTTGTLNLSGIVQNDRFRSLLRIYDFDPSGDGTSPDRQVLVRVYGVRASGAPDGPDTLLLERQETLRAGPPGPFVNAPMAQVPLWALPEVAPFDHLRVEITAATAGLRFWAFVSVTNNDTQHVTAIAPE